MNNSFALNINGDLYSATSAKINVFGDYVFGLRTITFKEECSFYYKVTISVELLKRQGDGLLVKLGQRAAVLQLGGVSDVPFDINVRLVEKAPLGASALDVFGAKIQGLEPGIQTGGNDSVWKLNLSVIRPLKHVKNGAVWRMVDDPYESTEGLVPVEMPKSL